MNTNIKNVKALARTKFNKGDVVYEIDDWDNKATVYARLMTIESWGKKRATGSYKKEDGSNQMAKYAIYVENLGQARYFRYYVLASDVENLEALLMQHAVEMRERVIADYRNKQHWYSDDDDVSDRYHVSMREDCQKVIDTEPSFKIL